MTFTLRTLAALSAVSIAILSSGCGPEDAGWGAHDALGNYNVTLDENVDITTTYANNPAVKSVMTFEEVQGSPLPLSEADVSYDAATNVFTVLLVEDMSSEIVHISGSEAKAHKTDGSVVAFDPNATDLESVTLELSLGDSTTITSQSTGCETDAFAVLSITLDNTGMTAIIHREMDFVTVGYTGPSAYVPCSDWLKTVQADIRSATPTDSIGLRTFVINGALDIDKVPDLTSLSVDVKFSGPKADTTAAASSALRLKSGAIMQLQMQ